MVGGLDHAGYLYAPFVFATTMRIRVHDIDALGHVNNAAYFTYVEELFAQSLEPVLGEDWVTVRVELDFRRELVLADEEVRAEARLERIGNSSLSFQVALTRPDGVVAADGRVVLVAWTPETRRSRPLSPAETEALGALA
jgi:acyl-CoA thioester hydrolase